MAVTNMGNSKVVNSNTFFFSPKGAGSAEAMHICCICKIFFNHSTNANANFQNHIMITHGYTDGG